MKKIMLVVGMLVLILFIAGCEADVSKVSDTDMQRIADKVIICNEPYMRFGSGCCIDQNKNGICDSDDNQSNVNEVKKVADENQFNNNEANNIVVKPVEKTQEPLIVANKGESAINLFYDQDYVGKYQLSTKGNIELKPTLNNVKLGIYINQLYVDPISSEFSREKTSRVALVNIGKVDNYKKLETEIILSSNGVTYMVGDTRNSVEFLLDSFKPYELGIEITDEDVVISNWNFVGFKGIRVDNDDSFTTETEPKKDFRAVENRQISTTYDVLASVEYDGNPYDFIFLYPEHTGEKEIAKKLADGLGLPMKTVEEAIANGDIGKKNMILFGGGCVNPAAEIFNEIPDCTQAFSDYEDLGKKGYVKLFKNGNYNIVNLAGFNPEDTNALVDFLLNFEENVLTHTTQYTLK